MDEISLIYESLIINEMTEDVIEYIQNNTDGKLPFDNIFGTDLRILIPIGGDSIANSIINDLKRIKDYHGFDPKTGEVIRKIKLDPKYGRGSEKEQRINIGRVVSSLNLDNQKKKEYLNWLSKYKDNLEHALNNTPEYTIVLSRAPVDIVRMSDHDNISSCHSNGGDYFHCAVQEAMTGGAVAYVVNTKQLLDGINEGDDLQGDDFFEDRDRDVDGIRPISRTRIRRIEDGYSELAIPETRIYGDSTIPGFIDTLKNFLIDKQESVIKTFIDSGGRGWEGRGGTYHDTSISSLIKNFLDFTTTTIPSKNFDDETSEYNFLTRGWEEELDSIVKEANDSMYYCHINAYIERLSDDPQVEGGGGCEIDISNYNILNDIELELDSNEEVERCKNGEYDDEENQYLYSSLISYLEDNCSFYFETFKISKNTISITFFDETNRGSYSNVIHFTHFSRQVESYDRFLVGILDSDKFFDVLLECNLVNTTNHTESKNRYNKFMETDGDYRSFELDLHVKYIDLTWGSIILIPPSRPPSTPPRFHYTNWNEKLEKFIYNYAAAHFKRKPDDNKHQTFSQFFESYSNQLEGISFTISPFNLYLSQNNLTSFPQYTISNYNIELRLRGTSDLQFEFLDFLDNSYDDIKNFLTMIVLNNLKRDDQEYYDEYFSNHDRQLKNLEKLYMKYYI